MNIAAFVLLFAMLAAYVVLDGYDLGVGVLHLLLPRGDRQRAAAFAAIGPFWNGNEAMLIAAAAAFFALFPRAYAAAFSGFYLPFIIVLWLLMIRGVSIELRGHLSSDLWRGFWDVGFSISSALLTVLFGIALGNMLRGVPMNGSGYFEGTFAFLLNGYAIGVGIFALAALAMHGAAFLWMRSDPGFEQRPRQAVRALVIPVFALFVLTTVATPFVRTPPYAAVFWIAPIFSLGSLVAVWFSKNGTQALTASSLFLLAVIASAAQTLFPALLPGFPNGTPGLDIYNAAPGAYSAGTAFTTAIVGVGAVLLYGTLTARRMLTKRTK